MVAKIKASRTVEEEEWKTGSKNKSHIAFIKILNRGNLLAQAIFGCKFELRAISDKTDVVLNLLGQNRKHDD
ncbi:MULTISPECIES: hypothetical protein [unclassified Nostoc]|uniref:hypothetical protein n=1 Tax=unclassified Nostoc TaxID=2593658 RepID=UPI00261ECBCA|nr:hypothetical protein [Nostoc sp. S13]MDF5737627.1 hypothetical protein [Nostoc sp. S13]